MTPVAANLDDVLDRNVLERRLAPTSDHRIPDAGDPDRIAIVMCDEGYSSSLAAATLPPPRVAARPVRA